MEGGHTRWTAGGPLMIGCSGPRNEGEEVACTAESGRFCNQADGAERRRARRGGPVGAMTLSKNGQDQETGTVWLA